MTGTKHDEAHAFCETISAHLTHIRPLTARGRKEGGGADTLALCDAEVLWDTETPFSARLVQAWDPWPYALCPACKAVFEEDQANG